MSFRNTETFVFAVDAEQKWADPATEGIVPTGKEYLVSQEAIGGRSCDDSRKEVTMTYWLTENALAPFLTGGFLTIALLAMAYVGREKRMLYAALFVAALTGGIVTTEAMIVTDREVLTEYVFQLAGYARTNDVDSLVMQISPARPDTVARLKSNMSQYKVESCNIVGFNEIEPNGDSATVDFVAWGMGSRKRAGGMKGQANPRVELKLEKHADGSWKITEYQVSDPRSGFTL